MGLEDGNCALFDREVIGCGAKTGNLCPRCSGWYAGTTTEKLTKNLLSGRLNPNKLPCGPLIERGREAVKPIPPDRAIVVIYEK